MEKLIQKVVVIGHGYASRLGVIRSVAQIGCEITVIVMTGLNRDGKTLNTKTPIDCYSRYVSNVHYCHAKDAKGLIQLLLEKCIDYQQKVVIIPDSDLSAAFVDQYQEQLADFFLFPHIHHEPGAVVKWMDKAKQKELAKKIGLNVAKACVVEIKNRQYSIPSSVSYPCYVKPMVTITGDKCLLRKCENEKELNAVLYEASDMADMQLLIEDFKTIDAEYAVVGFSDGRNVVIPGIIQMLIVSESRPGITLKGKVLSLSGFEEVVSKFKRFILNIGYVGLFDFDFYKSDEKIFFCELNLRFGGSGYSMTKMGVNLPAMLVFALTNKNLDDFPTEIHQECVFLNERLCVEDWYSGFISTKKFIALLNSHCHTFIKDLNDTRPMEVLNHEIRIKQIKKAVKGFLHPFVRNR